MFAGRLKKGLAQGLLKHPQTLLTLNTTNAALFHAQSAVLSKKILISDPIEDSCVDILESAGYSVTRTEKVPPAELVEMIKDYDGIIVRSGTTVTADVINAGDKLKLIGRAGTGVDNIDVDAATKKGQMVMNTPGGNTQSTAELSVSMLMSLSRNIPMADASLKSGRWDRKKYSGTELSGKTLGIVGLGQIGRRVAEMCQGLGMTTIGYDPILSPEVAAENKIELVSLDELYPRADFITIHTPLTSDTRKMFNDETFAKCKDTLRIVNCARGGIIDEQALLRALEAGTVAGAALDVYETEPPPAETKPVLEHPLVVCTPHLGASTAEAQEKVAQEIAQSFVDAFEGRRISGVVNSKILAELASRKDLHPYVDLSERMGSLQAQLIFGNLKHIEIETVGQTLKGGTGILMAALLKGVLSQMIEESVNLINAPHLAAEFGIKVTEKHTHSAKHLHGNNIKVTFKTDKGTRSLTGIVDRTGTPRLVEVDKFQMHLDLEGHSLFWSNIDKPGCISRITSILGENSVNISSFSLGRESIGGRAIGVLNVDSAVNDDVIDQLTCTGDLIYSVHTYLPPLGTEAADDADGSKPTARPNSACFGSGPVKKFPGYDFAKLPSRNLGRSHRSALGLDTLQQVIGEQARLLKIPRDYYVGIVPASDTGAFETAMWSMLGQRPVDICYWDSFGKGWYTDAVKELKLDNIREFKADYGELPDLTKTNVDHDIVFTWNGTTSGVKVPDGGWISADRKGLTFCDATSAVFAMDMPWDKLDVTTWSWQKALGGEGAHGMLVLSPRAVERLNTYTPAWPLPKLFRLTKNGKFCDDVFTGKVINTPSMLAVEDALLALDWVDSIGGLESMKSISEANLHVVEEFVEANEWIHFLAQDKTIRSNTSVCLTLDLEPAQVKELVKLLESENVAYDIGAYRDAPPGLRIWCGSTVETADVAVLMEWLKWAYNEVRNDAKEAGAQQE